ncbi:unnamed protein product [Blepharisma stoltei]|uniref:Kinesin-like protein n=1 Tax=Blepharisma stoltei TaxID=1481888 RepID=A0AAU9K1E9_9CILI|nr:unnamed protein product [Blepharisma stoltei]
MNQLVSPFEVYVRIRPLTEKEINNSSNDLSHYLKQDPSSSEILFKEPGTSQFKKYTFNGVFPENITNLQVYTLTVKKLVQFIKEGYNSTCFAYGCTGSGKTHTMFGHMNSKDNEPGNVIHALQECLELIQNNENSKLKLSYLEIYNEKVADLLSAGDPRNLMIIEDFQKGIQVPGLSEFEIVNLKDAYNLVIEGNQKRVKAPTSANELSTRSHAILQFTLEQKISSGEVLSSKLSLIDLAGSERGSASENNSQRMVEGANINRSLLALGNCINILSGEKKRACHVPYRDSKLTRLLKDSLGGNTRTIMIACISKSFTAYEETLNTLRYAQRASMITTKLTKTMKDLCTGDYKDIIKNLNIEIENLKNQLKNAPAKISSTIEPEDESLYDSLQKQLNANLKEYWECQNDLKEIKSDKKQSKEKLMQLINELTQEDTELDQYDKENIEKEILEIGQEIRECKERKTEIKQEIINNLKKKQSLQKEMDAIKDEKQREIIKLQIALRGLKREKMDLYNENLRNKEKAEELLVESENKDKIIASMQNEINFMKRQLVEHLASKEIQSNVSTPSNKPIIAKNFDSSDISGISEIRSSTPSFSDYREARFQKKYAQMMNLPERGSCDLFSRPDLLMKSRSSSATPKSENFIQEFKRKETRKSTEVKCILISKGPGTIKRPPLSSRASSASKKRASPFEVGMKVSASHENLAGKISKLPQKIMLPNEAADLVKSMIQAPGTLGNKNVW